MTWGEIAAAVEALGLPIILVIFLMWDRTKRDERQAQVEAELRTFSQEVLVTLVERQSESQVQIASCLTRIVERLDNEDPSH